MTSYAEAEVACALCGQLNQVLMLRSTSTFGAPDLDTRPAEMMRSTLGDQIQQCGRCGYCAPSLSEAPPSARHTLSSERYRAFPQGFVLPELAQRFLRWAEVMVGEEKPREAG